MKQYTYSEARQKLATLLTRAQREGGVRIRRRDGSTFVLLPERSTASPFDVPGLALGVGREELLSAIREGRRLV